MGTEGQLPNKQFDIQGVIAFLHGAGVLKSLLVDKSTGRHILWGTDAYADRGPEYARDQEIEIGLITGENSGLLKTRAQKAAGQQSERTRQHAEVFTPAWICRMMNDQADREWFGREDVFFRKDGEPTERVDFKGKSWRKYVDSKRLEITCGEAPYLVSRYDVSSGEPLPLHRRAGLLDRKLRVVNENATTEEDWLKWTFRAFEATYGYEFQGDNLLIARVNLMMTFGEYLEARCGRKPTLKDWKRLARVVVWNVWQMDGLTCALPYAKGHEMTEQTEFLSAFGFEPPKEEGKQPYCRIYLWRYLKASTEFRKIKEGASGMKFDFIIGNPPYQDESNGELRNYAPPIYHLFMEESYKNGNVSELIHPARFLFNAGSTPKAWNEKMLEDDHFKVIFYEPDSSKVFPGLSTPIKGGIAITYRDNKVSFGAIKAFTQFPEINSIVHKVTTNKTYKSIINIVFSRTAYRLTDAMHVEHPDALSKLSNGHAYDMSSNIFQRLPDIFFDEKPQDGQHYIQIVGRDDNHRIYKFVRRDYVNSVENLDRYKVFVAQANGNGEFGETISPPIVEKPGVGATETFISIGAFLSETEAIATEKYIKTKFARTLRSVLKVTQNGNKPVWRLIPLQDFTPASNIDWSQSIPDIDRQLYAKYGLDESEIAFIESHVKEMV